MNTQFQTTNFKCVASFNDTLTSGVEFLDCSEVQLEKFDLPRDNDWVVVETDCIWRTIHEGSRESPDFRFARTGG